jgi:hypothetical protein
MNFKFLLNFTLSAAAAASAGDTFGGLGTVIAFEENAVRVAEVFPGSPAEIADLRVGDAVLSADGDDFSGLSFAESSARLRGAPGKPVALRVLRGGDTLDVTVRRARIEVTPIGNAGEISASAAESMARRKAGKYRSLLSVARIAEVYSGVFLAKDSAGPSLEPKGGAQPQTGATLTVFSRNRIGVTFAQAGTVRIQVLNAQGVPRADFCRDAVLAGENCFSWNGGALPAGNYAVVLTQNGKRFRFAVTLS